MDQGRITGELASLAAQIAAAELGLAVYPTVDETTTQAEIDLAQSWLDTNPLVAGVDADTELAKRTLDEFVTKVRIAKVGTEAPNAKRTSGELDDVARDRTARVDTQPIAQLVWALVINAFIDHAARPRTVPIDVYIRTAPSEGDIIRRVAGADGRIVVPVDTVPRFTARIDGSR
jgi:hypothetical protein